MRDAQSLLDQAIVQAEHGQTVTAATIRDMLGLADRAQTIALFEQVMRGEAGAGDRDLPHPLRLWRRPGDQVMLDLLEHCHGASVAKAIGPDALILPKDQAARLAAVGAALSAGTLSRLWQMLLKAYDEVRRAPDPAAAVEMALIRLAYAADLPGPEEALKAPAVRATPTPAASRPAAVRCGGAARRRPAAASAAARAHGRAAAADRAAGRWPRRSPSRTCSALIEPARDIALKLDVERYVRPISFRPGAITFEPAPGAPANLAQRLVARLKEWTGQPWLIAAEGGGGAESLWERQKREERDARAEVEQPTPSCGR